MKRRIEGGCHCGAVRFRVECEWPPVVRDCNCSICRMSGLLHLIVPASAFELLAGEEDQIEYRFNTGVARHLFCRHCGITSWYVPRSNPDGVSVNARCLDGVRVNELDVRPFDGENWEDSAGELAHLSRE